MVIRVRKTSTNPDFRGVNPSSEPRAVLHRSGRASFLPRNADFRIGRAVFSPRAADFRSGNPCFLPRAELFRPVGALLSRHRRHRSRRFFSFPIHYIYTREGGGYSCQSPATDQFSQVLPEPILASQLALLPGVVCRTAPAAEQSSNMLSHSLFESVKAAFT